MSPIKHILLTPLKIPWPAFLLFGFLSAFTALYLLKTYPQAFKFFLPPSQQVTSPTVLNETQYLVEKIGKLIALPQDETPTIATVTDLEKAQTQAFFQDAKLGDKVLVYQNAKKAILYRPDENRIIGVANLKIQPPEYQIESSTPLPSPTATPSATPHPTTTPAATSTPKLLNP